MVGLSFQVSKPMSVKEISEKAQDFEFDPYIAMKYWLRTADTLLREVCPILGTLGGVLIWQGPNIRARRK
jgi:hypothetical protein